MKIKTKVLTRFLYKVLMDGEQLIREAILDFDNDGLKINANSPSQQARVMGWLKTGAFVEYESIGKIGMNDLITFVKALERFGDEITIKKEGHLLTIKSIGKDESKKLEIGLISETFLGTDTGEPELMFDDTFTMTALKLKDIFKDVQMSKDAIIHIITEDKKVNFLNTGKYKFENIISAPTCKGGVNVKFGQPLIDSTVNLDGNIEFSVKTDYPCMVRETTETSVVSIIIAPRVGDNE